MKQSCQAIENQDNITVPSAEKYASFALIRFKISTIKTLQNYASAYQSAAKSYPAEQQAFAQSTKDA